CRAQYLRDFAVVSLPQTSTLTGTPLEEALQDNTRSPVPDQVAFRHDFPAWLAGLGERDRRVITDLMLGERTLDVAERYGLSPARISQLRREFMQGWRRFCDPDDLPSPPPARRSPRDRRAACSPPGPVAHTAPDHPPP